MLNMQQAVERAKAQIGLLFPQFPVAELRLEEAETPLSLGKWRFVFSAPTPLEAEESSSPLASILRATRTRRVVELEPETGDLLSIKAA